MKRSLLQEALRIAVRKNTPETHEEWENYIHFTFVVQRNKIVEWGTNRSGRASIMHGFDPVRHKIHSEIDAFGKARGLLNKNEPFEVINVRLNRSNDTRLSAPCKCCTAFLNSIGCRKTWFTTDAGWAVTNG